MEPMVDTNAPLSTYEQANLALQQAGVDATLAGVATQQAAMGQVLIQIVADDQGEVSPEYMADIVRLLAPEEIVKLLTHFAAELDKDAKELQAGLQVGKLPRWVSRTPTTPE